MSEKTYPNAFEMLSTMVGLQVALNDATAPTWKTENFPWTTAIDVEIGELIDHLPWKWWKTYRALSETEINHILGQMKIELVDIMHFVISDRLNSAYMHGVDEAETQVAAALAKLDWSLGEKICQKNPLQNLDKEAIRLFLSLLGGERYSNLPLIAGYLGMTLDDMFRFYIGKNALNAFRQKNGYGTTYIKTWMIPYASPSGVRAVEDNVVLDQLINAYVGEPAGMYEFIMERLAEYYAQSFSLYAKLRKKEDTSEDNF